MRPPPRRIAGSSWWDRACCARSPFRKETYHVSITDADDRRDDFVGAGAGTQVTYIDAVRKLAAHYRRSPDQLTEEEVRAYLHLRESGAARGTFKVHHYGIQYFYRQTLNHGFKKPAHKNLRGSEGVKNLLL
jgi:hypothetical protein